jgi:hypothetical protein
LLLLFETLFQNYEYSSIIKENYLWHHHMLKDVNAAGLSGELKEGRVGTERRNEECACVCILLQQQVSIIRRYR